MVRRLPNNAGVSLIEAVMAIVVLGVAIPPLTSMFRIVAQGSVDESFQAVAVAYADGLMEEIVSKAFEDPEGAAGSFGTEEGARSAYDDLDDFDGLSNSPPKQLDGTDLDDYGGFTRSTLVENVTAADPDASTPAGDGTTDLKRVRVTVVWTGGGGGEYEITTLRTALSAAVPLLDPIDEVASVATLNEEDDKVEIDLVSISPSDAIIVSFSLSASSSSEQVWEIELDEDDIWEESSGVSLPTGVLALNMGSTSDRTVPAGDDIEIEIKFEDDFEDPNTYTLVLTFLDGTSSTLVFSVEGDD